MCIVVQNNENMCIEMHKYTFVRKRISEYAVVASFFVGRVGGWGATLRTITALLRVAQVRVLNIEFITWGGTSVDEDAITYLISRRLHVQRHA